MANVPSLFSHSSVPSPFLLALDAAYMASSFRILCLVTQPPPMPLNLGDLLGRTPCSSRSVGVVGQEEGAKVERT